MATVYIDLDTSPNDLQAYIPRRQWHLSEVSEPDKTTVTAWGEQTESSIEGRVAVRYTTPISSGASPKAFKKMKELCAKSLAARVWLFINQRVPPPNYGTLLDKEVENELKAIEGGANLMPDATAKVAVSDVEAKPAHNLDTGAKAVFAVGETL